MTALTEADIAARLESLESKAAILDGLLVNGLQDTLTGHGFQQFGAKGGMRTGNNGVEILATSGGVPTQAMWMVPAFQPTEPGTNTNYAVLQGNGYASDNHIELKALRSGGDYNIVQSYADASNNFVAMQVWTGGVEKVGMGVSEGTLAYAYVEVGPLRLFGVTADAAAGLANGMLWYRSDTNKFRARIAAVTENLATESYVGTAAPASTDYAHALMMMGA